MFEDIKRKNRKFMRTGLRSKKNFDSFMKALRYNNEDAIKTAINTRISLDPNKEKRERCKSFAILEKRAKAIALIKGKAKKIRKNPKCKGIYIIKKRQEIIKRTNDVAKKLLYQK